MQEHKLKVQALEATVVELRLELVLQLDLELKCPGQQAEVVVDLTGPQVPKFCSASKLSLESGLHPRKYALSTTNY